jgi:hypothetical protein
MKMRILCWVAAPILAGITAFVITTGQLPRSWFWAHSDPLIDYPARLDLGDHENGEIVVEPFTISNRGGSELLIDQIQSNCSCTGMEQIRDGRYERVDTLQLAAGKSANLVMRVAVRDTPAGAQMLNIVEFHTNDPSQPLCQIEAVVGHVSRGVTASPGSVVLGTVPVGAEVRQVLDIRDTAIPPRTIESVSSTNPARVKVRLLPVSEPSREAEPHPDGALVARLEVSVDTAMPGEVNVKAFVHLAGETQKSNPVSVIGKVAAPIELSPSSLVLPRASSNGPVYNAICTCRSTDTESLALSVDSIPSGLAAEILSNGTPSVRTVRITWDPELRKAPEDGQPEKVRLRAKAGKQESVLELQVYLQK